MMTLKPRTVLLIGIGMGLIGALALGVWWQQGPSEERVRRTVLSTVQEEAPASFLVTGTLEVGVTVEIDSAQYLTPNWATLVLRYAQPSALPMLQGRSTARVRVPGRVSYGFDVRSLTAEMIRLDEDGVVAVDVPSLSVYSVEPDLARLEVKTQATGWMRVFPSDVYEEVEAEALASVRAAFERQAERRIETGTQPRVNTARALEDLLTPPLKATGIDDPRFRIQVGDRLTLTPDPERR